MALLVELPHLVVLLCLLLVYGYCKRLDNELQNSASYDKCRKVNATEITFVHKRGEDKEATDKKHNHRAKDICTVNLLNGQAVRCYKKVDYRKTDDNGRNDNSNHIAV